MSISNELVVSMLHKDGAAALGKLLQDAGVGRLGAEGTKAAELATPGASLAVFVCHPEAWYLSLWRRGCQGKGALFERLTDTGRWSRLGAKAASRKPGAGGDRQGAGKRATLPAGWSAEHARTVWYGDASNAVAFREWLQALLGTPGMRRLVGATGGLLKASRWSGLMTREYVDTFFRDDAGATIAPESAADLIELDGRRSLAHHPIRLEFLAADTLAALKAAGIGVSDDLARAIGQLADAPATDVATFFDDDSRALVAKHEKFMAKKFGYGSADGAAAGVPAKRRRKRRTGKAAEAGGGSAEGGAAAKKAGRAKGSAAAKKAERAKRKSGDTETVAKGERKARRPGREQRKADGSESPAGKKQGGKAKAKTLMLSDRPDPEDLID